MSKRPYHFSIGDTLTPKPEWTDDPNQIPTGVVRSIEPFGDDASYRIGNDHRAFAGYVFERVLL